MKNPVRIFTLAGVEKLRSSVADNLENYYSGTPIQSSNLPKTNVINMYVESLSQILDEQHETLGSYDSSNAIKVYKALSVLTEHQASDERLWVYLCHVECFSYISRRFLNQRPETDEQAIRFVHNHFFVKNNRVKLRDNGLSRLWWLGYLAHKIDEKNPKLFLDILLHKQDITSSIVGRPFISMNKEILRSIYSVMQEHWEQGKNSPLFKRKVFRTWMIQLNRRGGVVLLDSLSVSELRKLVRDEAELSLSNSS